MRRGLPRGSPGAALHAGSCSPAPSPVSPVGGGRGGGWAVELPEAWALPGAWGLPVTDPSVAAAALPGTAGSCSPAAALARGQASIFYCESCCLTPGLIFGGLCVPHPVPIPPPSPSPACHRDAMEESSITCQGTAETTPHPSLSLLLSGRIVFFYFIKCLCSKNLPPHLFSFPLSTVLTPRSLFAPIPFCISFWFLSSTEKTN